MSRSGLTRVALGCAGGAGLCGFWLLPFLAHRDLQGIVTTWRPPPFLERLGAIATGRMLFPAGFALVVVVAWAYQLVRARRRRDPTSLVWVATPLAYLAVAHGLPPLVGLNGATIQLANRGLGYVGLLAILAVAALAAEACRRFEGRGIRRRPRAGGSGCGRRSGARQRRSVPDAGAGHGRGRGRAGSPRA